MLYRRDVAIVPNIVPQLAPRDACRSGNVIVDIADSSPRKNVKRLLEAFALVKRARPESELRLIGPGLEPASNMCQWAAERELIEGVAFLGRQTRDQVAEHLAEASVMCHASVEEAQPMCLLEAMAMGVPVIGGQRSGGVPWTLGADAEEGAAGLLVDVTSPVAMSQQMLYLLERDDEQERLRSLGETLVRDRHAPSIIAESFLTHYERIAG
jgi:glycosyltransferase involved in cell wall biosynthesis